MTPCSGSSGSRPASCGTKTQERVEELARERAAARRAEPLAKRAIDLTLVEDGIEFGKKMMAEMIATYTSSSTAASPSPVVPDAVEPRTEAPPAPAQEAPSGGGYLNEVRQR